MANIRAKDLPSVDTVTAGDRILIDGATTRSITVENFIATGGSDIAGTAGVVDNAASRANGTGGGTIQGSLLIIGDAGEVTLPEQAAPATPGAAKVVLYPKSDGRFYEKDDAGVERGLSSVGKHTIPIPASAMFPATTNGCAALAQAETSVNKVNYKYLAFDPASVEYAWYWFPTPKSYNAGTFTARFVWTHPATTTNFGVVWQAEILSIANDDALDLAVGTAVTVTDTGGTTQDFYSSDATGVITPSNTAAKQDWMAVRISRLASNGADNLAVDAHLIAVELYMTTDAATDD